MASVAQALRHEGVVVGDLAALELVQALRDDLVGAGPLQSLLDDPDVTDVIVNGPHDVCVDRGHGLAPILDTLAELTRREGVVHTLLDCR